MQIPVKLMEEHRARAIRYSSLMRWNKDDPEGSVRQFFALMVEDARRQFHEDGMVEEAIYPINFDGQVGSIPIPIDVDRDTFFGFLHLVCASDYDIYGMLKTCEAWEHDLSRERVPEPDPMSGAEATRSDTRVGETILVTLETRDGLSLASFSRIMRHTSVTVLQDPSFHEGPLSGRASGFFTGGQK